MSPVPAVPELWVCQLPVIDYGAALELQERVRAARQADSLPDVLLLLEHPPVYTRGRRSFDGELPFGEDWYRARGIEIVDVDRGGRLTYHGPGQLVGYPIVRVDDVVAYVRTLERALVAALGEEGVAARARVADGPDYTGVWVENRKIASIGVHVARGVTTHGFAVNVDNDLAPFGWVVACGLPGVQMTSLAGEADLLDLAGAERRVAAGAQRTVAAGAQWRDPAGAQRGRLGRPAGQPSREHRMPCFRKRVAYSVARALGRRQRIVSLPALYAAIDRDRLVTTSSSVARSRSASPVI